jgi:hypothetical protein
MTIALSNYCGNSAGLEQNWSTFCRHYVGIMKVAPKGYKTELPSSSPTPSLTPKLDRSQPVSQTCQETHSEELEPKTV